MILKSVSIFSLNYSYSKTIVQVLYLLYSSFQVYFNLYVGTKM